MKINVMKLIGDEEKWCDACGTEVPLKPYDQGPPSNVEKMLCDLCACTLWPQTTEHDRVVAAVNRAANVILKAMANG